MSTINFNSTAIDKTVIYDAHVLKGYVATLLPLTVFCNNFSAAAVQRGATVTSTFMPSGSAAVPFVEGVGYSFSGSTRQDITITLNKHYYVASRLGDEEKQNSSLVNIEDTAYQQGATLAAYLFSDVSSGVSGSNFSNGYNVASSSLYRVTDLIGIRKLASNLNWGLNRNIVINPNVAAGLLSDTAIQAQCRGDASAVREGVLKNVFGWNNIFESNALASGQVSGSNKQVGFAATSDALAFASRYFAPAPEANAMGLEAYALTDPTTGITIGVKKFYDINLAQSKTIYETVWGWVVANPKAAINLTATIDG